MDDALLKDKELRAEKLKGKELRAEMDRDTVRALVALNGGGAVALLALLPSILKIPEFKALAVALLGGVIIMVVGLIFTVAHNIHRRECALLHDTIGPDAASSEACRWSRGTRRAAITSFALAGFLVAGTGLWAVWSHYPSNQDTLRTQDEYQTDSNGDAELTP